MPTGDTIACRCEDVTLHELETAMHRGHTDIESVKRMKDDVREVNEGFECGIKLKNYNDIAEGDQLEFFEVKEVARTL